MYMLSSLPRRSDWASCLLIHPVVSAFPDRVFGSAYASFSRFARHSFALRPAHSRCHLFVTRITEGSSHFVTSIAASVASGSSGCRMGLTLTRKRRLFTAHTLKRHSTFRLAAVSSQACSGHSQGFLSDLCPGSHGSRQNADQHFVAGARFRECRESPSRAHKLAHSHD
jgi:hypothetical protein